MLVTPDAELSLGVGERTSSLKIPLGRVVQNILSPSTEQLH